MSDLAVCPEMSGVQSTNRPLKRLRTKTPVQEACVFEVDTDEDVNATKQVYLVTLSHPVTATSADGHQLRAPRLAPRPGSTNRQ